MLSLIEHIQFQSLVQIVSSHVILRIVKKTIEFRFKEILVLNILLNDVVCLILPEVYSRTNTLCVLLTLC